VPFYSNPFRDTPLAVRGSEVFCLSGRVLDLHTGRDVRREDAKDLDKYRKELTPSEALYESRLRLDFHKVQTTPGRHVSHKPGPIPLSSGLQEKLDGNALGELTPEDMEQIVQAKQAQGSTGFSLFGLDDGNEVLWSFRPEEQGYQIDGNFHSYRLHGGNIYMIVSQEPQTVPVSPRDPHVVKRQPVSYQLLELDGESGRIDRSVSILDRKLRSCDIQSVGDGEVFVRCDEKELVCYSLE
jgi:hypothetical protein